MKKYELIRGIFNIVMREGFNDNKQDAISEYTKDKMNNVVYVKKLNVPYKNIDSIAVTSMDSLFGDVCDSDLRIAINDKNIGKRVILYANELDYDTLNGIYFYLKTKYCESLEEKNYNILLTSLSMSNDDCIDITVNRNALIFVLTMFKKAYIDK